MTHPAEAAYHNQVAVHKTWYAEAYKQLAKLAATGEPFTADDVRAQMVEGQQPPHPNCWGGLFMQAHREGLIRHAGGGPSTIASRQGGYRHMWVGRG